MGEHKLAYGRATLAAPPADGEEPLTFVASTTNMNRKGFALRNEGWRLDNYNANPVVLWMHNPFTPPIGTGRALSKTSTIVLDGVRFDRDDELARMVESKYRRGFLNAVSVGWDFVREDGTAVLDWWRLRPEEIRDELWYDLAEVSAVSVPGDPGALRKQSRSALSGLGRELVDLFDDQESPTGVLTREQVGEAVRAELARLGIPLPDKDKDMTPVTSTVDQGAAAAVLAAFDLQ
ncbi:hypothetical protein [Actinokineospora sp. UTMC 2448]|uniref:hypothetical protein n=1 Tax=Actinokineospora sp. UTMC 2448 TaxID=2268449 RepID=UPI0021649182|nr:hypothetical protein [Actinokineospora sp. UTMC 2448]UVS81836.1 hypothetical protein Actkin_05600 [Actinokineospora sp. UTMC 2448]